ncbi:MAG TPA: YfjI family protein [Thermoanaerobaculia bacterium]|nr:YfjI family protein [Thermoanaerobaculia bacterium]
MSVPEAVARLAEVERAAEDSAPRPLGRELPPAEPYPVEALGPVLAPVAEAVQDVVRCPAAIAGQSVLGVAALAAQAHVDVQLPSGATRPASLYLVTLANSGERKTTADDLATEPAHRRESELADTYGAERLAHRNAAEAWEKSRAAALKVAKTLDARRAALDALGAEPEPPPPPILLAPDPTMEGLVRLFMEGQPSLGLFSGEGAQFLAGWGMAKEQRLRTVATLSALWDGGTVRRVRAGDGAVRLAGRRLSAHLLVQPEVADVTLLGDPLLASQGILSRLLVAAPDPAAGSRLWVEPSPESREALARWRGSMGELLARPLPLGEDRSAGLLPLPLPLAPDARALWIAFADHVERQLGAEGDYAPVRAFAAKAPEHAARVAAVLSWVADPGISRVSTISGETLALAISLVEHYIAEALRLQAAGAVSESVRLARSLHAWLQSHGLDRVSLVSIYQRGPAAIRDAATARGVVGTLEEHGWLRRLPEGLREDGVLRRDAWEVVTS